MSPRGRVRMLGIARWHRYQAPKACVRTTRSNSAGSVFFTVLPRLAMPALLIRMSTKPKSLTTASTIVWQASRLSTEAA